MQKNKIKITNENKVLSVIDLTIIVCCLYAALWLSCNAFNTGRTLSSFLNGLYTLKIYLIFRYILLLIIILKPLLIILLINSITFI